jgi:hypothetical protein
LTQSPRSARNVHGPGQKACFKPNKKHTFGLQISQRLKNEETAPLQPNKKTSWLHTIRNERGPFARRERVPFLRADDSLGSKRCGGDGLD